MCCDYQWLPGIFPESLYCDRCSGMDHGHVTHAQYFSLCICLFFLHPSLSLSHSLSLILFHENNGASLSTGTVIQLQTSPCFLHPLNSAYLSVFSCHCLIPCLKFQHFILLAREPFLFFYNHDLLQEKAATSVTWLWVGDLSFIMLCI